MRVTRRQPVGFTLAELLVVIGIIVIVAVIAIPSIRALTGSRSTESAHNQLAGLLGRARGQAIALQRTHGVAFFIDRETGRVAAYIVKQVDPPSEDTIPDDYPPAYAVDLYLDYLEDHDPVLLPSGVGVQMIDDAAVATADTPTPVDDTRGDDAYIGFNT